MSDRIWLARTMSQKGLADYGESTPETDRRRTHMISRRAADSPPMAWHSIRFDSAARKVFANLVLFPNSWFRRSKFAPLAAGFRVTG